MTPTQYLGLVATCFVGSFCAGALAWSAKPAQAQTVTVGQGRQPQIVTDVTVPNQGLRFISPNGRPVALLGADGAGGALILLDSAGNPSVALRAGAAATIEVRGSASSRLEVGAQDRKVSLSSQGSGGEMGIFNGGTAVARLLSEGASTSLQLAIPRGNPVMDLRASSTGANMTLRRADGFQWLTTNQVEGVDSINMADAKTQSKTQIASSGKIVVTDREGKSKQWPPKEE